MKNKSLKWNKWKIITATGFSLAYMLLVYCLVGIFFETNDDRIISEILSGAYTGRAEAHVVYVNYLLALPLKWLYNITTAIPWYGLYLLLQHFIAGTFLFDSIYDFFEEKRWRLAGLSLTFILLLAYVYLLGQIQYTSTAALLALVGYVCLILKRSKKKGYVLFFLFELLAILLRKNAMLMIQPFGMAAYIGLCLGDLKAWKEKGKRLGSAVGILAAVALISLIGEKIGYHEDGWEEYHQFNDASVMMFDYYGMPPYEEVQQVLKNHNVSRAEYESYIHYTILEGNIDAEVAQELARYVVNRRKEQPIGMREMILKLINSYVREYYWGMNIVTIFTWGASVFVFFVLRDRKMLFPMGGMFCAHVSVWAYLLWHGRTPLRVMLPLLLSETVLLWIIIWMRLKKESVSGVRKLLVAAVGICVCLVGMKAFSVQIPYLRSVNSSQAVYMQGMKEIQDYCRKYPERKYLVEATTLNYYKGDVLENEIYDKRNYMITGGWYSYSPPVRYSLQSEYGDWEEGIRLIIQEGQPQMIHPALRYLKEKTGFEPEVEEKFQLSNGADCVVYRFDVPNQKER